MKKLFVFVALFSVFSGFLICLELTLVSPMESSLVAQYWLIYINKIPFENKMGEYFIKSIEPINYKGSPLCEIYHLYPRGHMLVNVYKELVPLKSFSVVSDFNPECKGYEYAVLEELKATVDSLKSYKEGEFENAEEIMRANGKKWDKTVWTDLSRVVLYRGEAELKKRPRGIGISIFRDIEPVEAVQTEERSKGIETYILRDNEGVMVISTEAPPLLNTHWDQGEPYYNQCPILYDQRSVVGCVATAMSQIMRYYEWPIRGVGTHSYTCPTLNNRKISADFSNEYDWKNMPYITQEYDIQAEKDAVSELCYEAGVSVNMNYGVDESVISGLAPVLSALKDHFKYKTDVKVVWRNNSNVNAWFNVFKIQRDLERPVEFAIWVGGGHAVVVDGYLMDETSNKVHINMGWANDDNTDTYYDLDNIRGFTYPEIQHAVIDIVPAWVPLPPLNFSASRVMNRSLARIEYINVLNWEANPRNDEIGIKVATYRIYESNNLLAEVDKDTFSYLHRDVSTNRTYVYEIASVSDKGDESDRAIVIY